MKLSDDQIDIVLGYVDGAYRVMGQLGISKAELDDALLDVGVEQCKNVRCGHYAESGEMLDEDGEPDGFCCNCRRYDKPKSKEL